MARAVAPVPLFLRPAVDSFLSAAQGTIRPWSERGFFLLFHSLFGLDSLPFRVAAFVTMSVDLLLVAWLTRRLTVRRSAASLRRSSGP